MNRNMGTRWAAALTTCLAGALTMWAGCGCASQPTFPAPIQMRSENQETIFVFDTNHDGRADFWQYQGGDGRKDALAYARDETGQPGRRVELDAIGAWEVPHVVIVLDGVPFEVVAQLRREGRFRLFYPPSRVICCFPSMTDLALSKLFHAGPCLAYQASYFDRRTNRLTDANAVYLSGDNSPWLARMNYRCSFWWDAKAYLDPQSVFDHELNGMVRAFRAVDAGEACAYSVGTAGLGTRGGRPGIAEYLGTIDRLCEQIVCERHGRVKITLTADHGHNLVENRRISFGKVLEAGGYRRAKSLRGSQDVVGISYGLVTYAAFFTKDPAGVANCLLRHEDVEFACYPSGNGVTVCDRTGRARITKGKAGLVYDSSEGDPLKLAAIVEGLRGDGKVSVAGEIDAAAMFEATLDHYYPDPLVRIWDAFHGLVKNPPDLVVNLRDGACYGSRFFHAMIGQVRSTHGSLNRMNSTTFVLTMLGELPPAMRSEDVLPALDELRAAR